MDLILFKCAENVFMCVREKKEKERKREERKMRDPWDLHLCIPHQIHDPNNFKNLDLTTFTNNNIIYIIAFCLEDKIVICNYIQLLESY